MIGCCEEFIALYGYMNLFSRHFRKILIQLSRYLEEFFVSSKNKRLIPSGISLYAIIPCNFTFRTRRLRYFQVLLQYEAAGYILQSCQCGLRSLS